MDPIKEISQETLDRLADGELDEVRRREVIESLGCDDDGWERCALAFLESQSFGQEMRRVYRDDHHAEARVAKPAVERPRSFRAPSKFGWWLTTVASVVFAFALGTRLQPNPATPISPSPTLAESLPTDGQQHQLAGLQPADIWRGESMVPSDIESMLNRLGHRVDRRKGFMPVLSADGNQLLVPYEDVRIRTTSNAPQ